MPGRNPNSGNRGHNAITGTVQFGVQGNPTWRIMGLSKVISTLIGVISIVTQLITLVTKSHDPLSIAAVS